MDRPDGPTSRALDALWARFAHPTRRLLSTRVRRELELRSRFDITPIDPAAVAREVPAGARPACRDCPDRCCGGYDNVVSLRLRDLAIVVDLGRTDLLSRKKPRFPDALLAERPNLRALSESLLWRALPVMRQLGPARTCAALDTEGRCSLHPAWPLSCARFPYALDPVRRRVRWGSRCPVQAVERDDGHADALFEAAIRAYEEKVRDAVLLVHARAELEALALGPWLTRPEEDALEPPPRLPVLG